MEKFFFDNGNLKEELNRNSKGELDGVFKKYYPNGSLRAEGMFKSGIQQGKVFSYYHTGSKKRVANFVNGEFEGLVEEWWPNGKLKLQINYKKDNPIGDIQEWDFFGKKITNSKVSDYYEPGIDVSNKVNYRILKEILTPEVVFKEFSGDIKMSDWAEGLHTQYQITKEFESEALAEFYFNEFVKKYSYIESVNTNEYKLFKRDQFEFIKIENIIILSSLLYFKKEERLPFTEQLFDVSIDFDSKEFISPNWVQGIGLISMQHDKPILYNPYYGITPSNGENIQFYCETNFIAEYIADQVILRNGGFDSFRTLQHLDSWREYEYAYAGPLFVIFITGTMVVLNRVESSIKRVDGKKSETGISSLSDQINSELPGLRRLIYNEGDGMVQDGRFWINEGNSIIHSWFEDKYKALNKFKEIIEEHAPSHLVFKFSNESLIKKLEEEDLLEGLNFFHIKINEKYFVDISKGNNFMHITIIIND